jgi:hypothetical protein
MFDTHKLNDKGFQEVKIFKVTMALAVNTVLSLLPDSREKSIFQTKVEEAMFFGTKAIAAKTENHTEVIKF